MCSTGPETKLFPMPAPAPARSSCEVDSDAGFTAPCFRFFSLSKR